MTENQEFEAIVGLLNLHDQDSSDEEEDDDRLRNLNHERPKVPMSRLKELSRNAKHDVLTMTESAKLFDVIKHGRA